MKSPPLISVVVPAYNAEPFIERTLRSALHQSYTNIEVIVVNDGSTDNTKAIVEKVAAADDRVRVLSIPNGGVAKARNTGIENAAGEFVAFLDADDLWHPSKIELQVAALCSKSCGEGAVAAYTLSRIIDASDRIIRNENAIVFSGYSFARHLYTKPVGNGSSLIVRRDVAVAVGGFDSSYAARGIGGSEDLDFELRIAAEHPIKGIPLYLVGYRTYPGNMSSNRRRMARAVFTAVMRHIQLHPELPNFAIRSATSDAREYVLGNLITGRHWPSAAREFALLLFNDFGRGIEYGAEMLRGRLGMRLSLLNAAIPVQMPGCGDRTAFYDISPDYDVNPAGRARRPRDQKIIERLETLDALLAKRISRKGRSIEATAEAVNVQHREESVDVVRGARIPE